MRLIVIGLHGQKQNGKTALRSKLCERLEKLSSRISSHTIQHGVFPFADGLKKILSQVYESCTTRDHWYGWRKEEPIEALGGKTARQLMVDFGTKLIRDQFDRDFWVRLNRSEIMAWATIIGEMDPDHNTVSIAIIDDVRFENEAKMIASFAEHRIYRVVNTNIPEVYGNDPSEQILDPGFLTDTLRASSLEELDKHADRIIESLNLCSPMSR